MAWWDARNEMITFRYAGGLAAVERSVLMPISDYMRGLRELIGSRLVLSPGVAAVIRDEAGRVLCQLRADNHRWSLPAGAVDPGENPAQALIREVYEETGLRVVPERIVGVFGGPPRLSSTYANGDRCEYTVTIFACRVVGGRLEARDGESADLRYFPPDALPALTGGYPPAIFDPELTSPVFDWDDAWLARLDEVD